MAKLSPTQRDSLAADGRQRFQQELERYARMSPAEKSRYLDQRIDETEKMRQQLAQRNPNGGGPGAAGAFGAGPGGPGGGRGGPSLSSEDRDRRRRERLDQTTPEFRALMDQFRKDMANRRQQRGLAGGGPPRRG